MDETFSLLDDVFTPNFLKRSFKSTVLYFLNRIAFFPSEYVNGIYVHCYLLLMYGENFIFILF